MSRSCAWKLVEKMNWRVSLVRREDNALADGLAKKVKVLDE